VLLYSMVLYLLGIAVVLYLRPALMFKNNGQWKEFGSNGTDTTYFPFWLFCIVWAVVAYGSVSAFVSDRAAVVAKATAAAASLTARIHEAATPVNVTASAAASGPEEATEEAAPGYYKLDKALMKRKGVPRYIYVGEEKPSDLEDV
jgi:hypothetical protein